MKKLLFIILILAAFSFKAKAISAYPYPINYTQPDGTTITIQIHGDEFLSWTTSGNRLVSRGDDGFYYYAYFDNDGIVRRTISRASSGGSITQMTSGFISTVTPPAISVMNALKMREEFMSGLKRNMISTGASRRSAEPSISMGNNHFLILLIQFSDLSFSSGSAANIGNMLNQAGYSDNGGTGSVNEYYSQNSTNQFTPIFDVVGPITVSGTAAFYGAETEGGHDNYSAIRTMVLEACRSVDSSVNFSQYDNDGDGYVDNVFFFFAGHNQAEGGGANTIWPHAGSVYSNESFDGKKISSYGCTSEFKGYSGTTQAGIGTFCHEFGHVIGLPDFYDIDYETNGDSYALYMYSLMSSGSYNNEGRTPPYLTAKERQMLGWMNFPGRLTSPGNKTLQSVNNNKAYYTPTGNPGEYFQFESRVKSGWDAYIPKEGLLIFHVDSSQNMVAGMTAAQRWLSWNINSVADHQCFDLVESGVPVRYNGDFIFPGDESKTSFTPSSSPAFVDWSGIETGYGLTNIAATLTGASFTLSISTSIKGKVTNSAGDAIAGAKVTVTQMTTPQVTNDIIVGNDGLFAFDNINPGVDCRISISADRYSPRIENITTVPGSNARSYILLSAVESLNTEIKKHNGNPSILYGYGSGEDCFGAFSLTSTEINANSLTGKIIKEISFYCHSSAVKTYVMVQFGNEEVLRREVASPVLNSMNVIDISDERITVPSDKTVYLGYGYESPTEVYPMVTDNGPAFGGGSFYISDTGNPDSWYDAESDSGYNLLVSASFDDASRLFTAFGYNVISSNKATYSRGESIPLTITVGGETPESVTWTFDGAGKANGSTIPLTTTGNHTVIATLTYSDGRIETIEKVIVVE